MGAERRANHTQGVTCCSSSIPRGIAMIRIKSGQMTQPSTVMPAR